MTPLEAKQSSLKVEESSFDDSQVESKDSNLSAYRLDEPPSQTGDSTSENDSKVELPTLEVVDDSSSKTNTDNSKPIDFSTYDTVGDLLSHPFLTEDTKPKQKTVTDKENETDDKDWKNQTDILEELTTGASQNKLPEIEIATDSVDGVDSGTVWQKSKGGNWSFRDQFGSSDSDLIGFDPAKSKIANIEKLDDTSLKFSLDDGSILRQRPDGSTIQYDSDDDFSAGRPKRIFNLDKSTVDLKWSKDKLSSLESSNGEIYNRLESGLYAKSGSDWQGELSVNPDNGEITTKDTRSGASGIEITKSTDGSTLEKMPDGTLKLALQSAQDNTKRVFTFDSSASLDNLTQPVSMDVITPDGKTHSWQKVGENNYKINGSIKPSEIKISRSEAGEYEYHYTNTETGYSKTVSNDSVKTIDPGTEEIRTVEDGKLAGIRYDQSDYKIDYDESGQASKILDVERNTTWSKQPDGKWIAQQASLEKTYQAPEQFDTKFMADPDLSAEQKIRMLDSSKQIRKSDQFDSSEKDKFFANVSRLIDKKAGTTFSEQERANLAEQTLWHVANSSQNDQGSALTCNVTTIRGVFLKEQPSVVAGLVADVANTGQLKTKDGSIIKPSIDSLRPRSGSSEETFPPVDGSRSWLGQVWDVTAANVYYQRQTQAITGATVPKGSLSYELVPKTEQSDHGERLVRFMDGRNWTLHKQFSDNTIKPYDGPQLHSSKMLDVYDQLTDKGKDCVLIADTNRGVGNSEIFDKLGGERAGTVEELQELLSTADFPLIVQLNSGVLRQNANMKRALAKGENPSKVELSGGGEHVVLINGYQAPEPGSNGTGTVNIDNSWGAINDFGTAQEVIDSGGKAVDANTISVEELLKSMQRKVTSSSNQPKYSWTWVAN